MTPMHVVSNSSDPGQIRKAEDQEKDRERDLEFILSTERGRRYIHTLVHTRCHISSSSHVPSCSDSTAFNEGARSVGEAVLNEVRQDHPKAYIKMIEENHFDA
jgi:hypothetical protein